MIVERREDSTRILLTIERPAPGNACEEDLS
jgi:hypothetical protein